MARTKKNAVDHSASNATIAAMLERDARIAAQEATFGDVQSVMDELDEQEQAEDDAQDGIGADEQEADFVDLAQMEAEDGDDEFAGKTNSVVKNAYKAKYRERAVDLQRKPKGVATKALKRQCGDWLAIELARRTLDEKAKLVVPAFEAILDANGVSHAHWNRTTKGWQGRLRMTGRLALQRVVAETGELALPDGATIAAPKTFVAKHTH